MKNLNKILELANIFQKIAQNDIGPEDIKNTLQRHKLWNISSLISPLLEFAGVRGHTTIDINININPGPIVDFISTLNPNQAEATQKFNNLLKQKFSNLMTEALKNNKLDVVQPVSLNWLTIKKINQ